MKRIAGLLVASMMLAASMAVGGQAEAATAKIIPAKERGIENQYIVVLKEGANPRSVAAVAGVQPKHVYESALNGFAAALNQGQLAALQHNPSVDYIEQDGEVSINTTQTVGAGQWGLDRIDQRYLPLSGTYTYNTTASTVSAYVIDTGITLHSDFGNRATVAYDAIGGNGIDCNGHGTFMAGVIGSATWGVAKGVKLRGVRVLNCSGSGSWSSVIAGIDWVRANAVKPAVANITAGGSANASVDFAVNNLANSGVFVGVIAGSNNSDACNFSPARAANAYAVAASDRTDTRHSASNFGSCVDIYSPGINITSTWYTSPTATMTLSGTSAAASHVTGVAALYVSTNPAASAATVTNWLNTNATVAVIQNNPPGTPNRLVYKSTL
ncbi:MAG TPA: S8 family peptidase [Herpetosiphonaceae bacterium]